MKNINSISKNTYNNQMKVVEKYGNTGNKDIKYSSRITSNTHKDNKCDQSVQLNKLIKCIEIEIKDKIYLNGPKLKLNHINLLMNVKPLLENKL